LSFEVGVASHRPSEAEERLTEEYEALIDSNPPPPNLSETTRVLPYGPLLSSTGMRHQEDLVPRPVVG